MSLISKNPQQIRPSVVVVSRADSMRMDAYVHRVGRRRAMARLDCGCATLDAAKDEGRMMAKTHARVFAALERAEAEDAPSPLARGGKCVHCGRFASAVCCEIGVA